MRRAGTVLLGSAVIAAVALTWPWRPGDAPEPVSTTTAVETEQSPASLPGPAGALAPPPREGRDDTAAPADEPAREPPASPSLSQAGASVPEILLGGDFPPYLAAVAHTEPDQRDPRGCKLVSGLLVEMAGEARDDLWAPRVERELRAMLGDHPMGFAVSVGCRATICQVTEIGTLVEHDLVTERAWAAYWSGFMQKLRSSPVAAELATRRFFSGNFPPHPNWLISGYVFTTVGHAASPGEPADCAPFEPGETP